MCFWEGRDPPLGPSTGSTRTKRKWPGAQDLSKPGHKQCLLPSGGPGLSLALRTGSKRHIWLLAQQRPQAGTSFPTWDLTTDSDLKPSVTAVILRSERSPALKASAAPWRRQADGPCRGSMGFLEASTACSHEAGQSSEVPDRGPQGSHRGEVTPRS